MTTNKFAMWKHCRAAMSVLALMWLTMVARAADPGLPYPTLSDVSDQKAGSLLFYNYYTSSSCCPSQENTRINVTNTNPSRAVTLHLFFVDGATCSVADSFLSLSQNMTTTFSMSEVDPGVMGYLVAVAVDGTTGFAGGTNTGRPISYNFLIGDEYIELSSGHQTCLPAESFTVIDGPNGPVDPAYVVNATTATLVFNNTPGNYNRAPQMLAISSIPSPSDSIAGYNTQLILNRIGGSLVGSALPLGPIFGLLINDECVQLSYTFSSASCQFRSQINRNFPRTAPRPNQLIPEGRTGWSKLYSVTDNVGLLGSVLVANNGSNTLSLGVETLNGGRNLHKLRLADTVTYTMPVFPPN